MQRLLLATFTLTALMAGTILSAEEKDKKDKDTAKPTAATVTKVDAKKGEITVKFTDPQGKEAEKTFRLTKDIHIFDETGRAAAIDVFESGHDVLIVEAEGNLKELRRAPSPLHGNSVASQVRTLIEMCAYDSAGVEELQRIYDEIDQLEKTEVKLRRFTTYRPLFQWPLLAALGLFGLELLLGNTRLRRIP